MQFFDTVAPNAEKILNLSTHKATKNGNAASTLELTEHPHAACSVVEGGHTRSVCIRKSSLKKSKATKNGKATSTLELDEYPHAAGSVVEEGLKRSVRIRQSDLKKKKDI